MRSDQIGFDPSDSRVAAAVEWIHQDLSRNITLSEAAAHVHLTRVHLGNLFKADVGMRFTSYLAQVRMAHAKTLLHDFSLSLDEVARCCGYKSTCAFAVAFKSWVGVPPSVYRRKAVR